MTVRMAGVEMIDGDPLELRAEILFHLAHKPTDERFEVGKLIAVLGRNDHPELMPILTAAFEERLAVGDIEIGGIKRSEEHTSELQSLMRISYAVFCLKKKNDNYMIQ